MLLSTHPVTCMSSVSAKGLIVEEYTGTMPQTCCPTCHFVGSDQQELTNPTQCLSCPVLYLQAYSAPEAGPLRPALELLASLYGMTRIERDAAFFLGAGLMDGRDR
jgi:hypothetical protein